MVEAVLGEKFTGVVVSDFSVGYQHYPGVKQKCWAHLLRDVHDLRVAHEKDADVQAWAAAVHDVYRRAVAWKETHAADGTGNRQQAERALRGYPLGSMVTSRKISGGTRSAAGSETKMTLASLFGTWRVRGINPFTACRALLISP